MAIREIIFRGKRVDNGEWVYGDLLTGTDIFDGCEISEKTGMGDRYDIDTETVGQYTGLKDKNGKKIFEGDIVLFEDESPTNYEYHDCTEFRCGEIKFDDGQFYITNRIAVEMEDLIYNGIIDCEVIGNAIDNKELLGE